MRKFSVLLVPALMILAVVLLAAVELRAEPPLAAKDLMLSELSAIRRDVAKDLWGTASARAVKLNDYWAQYRRTHPGLKQSTHHSYLKHYNSLRQHIKERSKAKVYVDLSALRTIITVLKA